MMFGRLVVVVVGVGAMLVGPTASAVAKPETGTVHQRNVVETFVDVPLGCGGEGPLYSITTTADIVMTFTGFADGRVHETFTQVGRFVAEPMEGDGPSYSGRFTFRGGLNQNTKSLNGTVTRSVRGTASDGSRLNVHVVDHFHVRPDGTVSQFFRCL